MSVPEDECNESWAVHGLFKRVEALERHVEKIISILEDDTVIHNAVKMRLDSVTDILNELVRRSSNAVS